MNKIIYSNIVDKEALRDVQQKTLDVISKALVNSFGPNGTNTCYREEKALAKYTKDGHTILKKIMFNGPIEFTMRDDLENITRRIVTTVGDGTTSAILLSANIFKGLCEASSKLNISDKQIIKDLNEAIENMVNIIESRKKETTLDDIHKIAMISTDNDEYIANLIKDIYSEYGMEVFIDVGASNNVDTFTREYDGFTINSGFADIAFINNTAKHNCEIYNPKIYLFEDPVDTMEMTLFMEQIIHDNIMEPIQNHKLDSVIPTVIVCPKIGKDVNTSMDELIKYMNNIKPEHKSRVPIVVITNINDLNYLMDLSYISGAKLIKKYIDPAMQKRDQDNGIAPTINTIHDFAGTCELVVADALKTKFVNPALQHNEDGSLSDLYLNRLNDMEEQLKALQEDKKDTTEIGRLKKRINSYKANQVEIIVGGISEADRDARRDLVEDAVLNCRSAALDGYGYGANYEGFYAVANIVCQINWYLREEENGTVFTEKRDIENLTAAHEQKYIYDLILNAYSSLWTTLYNINSDEELREFIKNSLEVEKSPYNIRSREFDKKVLSSIKTDIVILEAIGKIIGLVFATNQFLVSSVPYNTYTDFANTTKATTLNTSIPPLN